MMDEAGAEQIIHHVEGQRHRVRKALGVFWFPLMLFGGVALVLALAIELGVSPAILAVWIIAGPAGIVATSIYYGRRTNRVGVSAAPLPFILTGLVLGIGAGLAGWLGRGGPLGYAGPLLIIGFGYLVFARLQRSLLAGVFALGLVAAAIGLYVLQPPHALTLGLGCFGLGSLLVGAWNLRQATGPG